MGHLLYLIFRCDFDVMENLERVEKFWDLNTPQDHRFGSSEIKVHFRRKNNRHTHTDRSRERDDCGCSWRCSGGIGWIRSLRTVGGHVTVDADSS